MVEKQTYEAEIKCIKCGNTDFKLTLSVFEGSRAVIAECKCGRRVEYRITDCIDLNEAEKIVGEYVGEVAEGITE